MDSGKNAKLLYINWESVKAGVFLIHLPKLLCHATGSCNEHTCSESKII